jgi:hypothetical protein
VSGSWQSYFDDGHYLTECTTTLVFAGDAFTLPYVGFGTTWGPQYSSEFFNALTYTAST